MSEWFYVPENLLAAVFLALMGAATVMLYWWHTRADNFNLRDALTSPGTDGVRRVDTSKAILVGVFLVSSYLLADNYSESAFVFYLTAWIVNGGAVLAYKAFSRQEDKPSVLK